MILLQADARHIPLADESVHCVVTSPPYWGLRDYGVAGQIGLERTPDEYIAVMLEVFREVKRVLRDDGTLWLNMGDSYAGNRGNTPEKPGLDNKYKNANLAIGHRRCDPKRGVAAMGQPYKHAYGPGLKEKDLCGIPWMLAFALRADGWYLRSDIIWSKPNPMPESVTDRPTKAHEYIFLLSKSERYYYDQEAILERVSPDTHARLSQNVEKQVGSERANGGQKTNGNMKAVGRKALPETQAKLGTWRDNQRKLAASGSGIKSNESFSNSVCCLVEKRNKRSVWEVTTQSFSEAHFATFPEELIKPCILAGCPAGGTVLDPFSGSGTTALVARSLQCNAVGLELNAAYIEIARRRLGQDVLDFSATEVKRESTA